MSNRSSSPPAVLAFAGSDPTGGAGLQADLLTLSNLGCYALSVVTALTAQDTSKVDWVGPVDAKSVTRQATVALADIHVAAFKIGMVGSPQNAAAIAKIVRRHAGRPVVLDPVLASGRGDSLASDGTLAALRKDLLPAATLLTPNSIEVRRLAGMDADADPAEAARALIDLGVPYVLVTGTHEPHRDVVNTLYGIEGILREDAWERLPGSYHGSGCTLAAAIAGALANGLPLAEAVRAGQEYTWQTLVHAHQPGRGQGIPDRFFWARHESLGLAGGAPAAAPRTEIAAVDEVRPGGNAAAGHADEGGDAAAIAAASIGATGLGDRTDSAARPGGDGQDHAAGQPDAGEADAAGANTIAAADAGWPWPRDAAVPERSRGSEPGTETGTESAPAANGHREGAAPHSGDAGSPAAAASVGEERTGEDPASPRPDR